MINPCFVCTYSTCGARTIEVNIFMTLQQLSQPNLGKYFLANNRRSTTIKTVALLSEEKAAYPFLNFLLYCNSKSEVVFTINTILQVKGPTGQY